MNEKFLIRTGWAGSVFKILLLEIIFDISSELIRFIYPII